jgi:hypothetical protein
MCIEDALTFRNCNPSPKFGIIMEYDIIILIHILFKFIIEYWHYYLELDECSLKSNLSKITQRIL